MLSFPYETPLREKKGMILLNCPVYNTPIPNGASTCPACGTPVNVGAGAGGFNNGQGGYGGGQPQGGYGGGYNGGYGGGYGAQPGGFKPHKTGYSSWFKILSWVFAAVLLIYAIYYGFMVAAAPFGGWLIGFENIQTLYIICLVILMIGFALMVAVCVLMALDKTGKVVQMVLLLVGWALILICAFVMEAQLSGVASPQKIYGNIFGTSWFVIALVNTLVADIAAITGTICLFLQNR